VIVNIPASKPGDLFLLFHSLPYDFSADLPLAIGHGVCLETTPQELLATAEKGLADFLLPGYSLHMGICNCCLRCFVKSVPSTNLTPTNLLFLSVIALRLHAPIGISIGGQFRLGEEGDRILELTLYEVSAPWSSVHSDEYTPEAIASAAHIADRLMRVEQLGFTKLQTALIFFGQVTVGKSSSFQLCHMGLFAALEAMFVPSGNKALTLSRRVSSFLRNF